MVDPVAREFFEKHQQDEQNNACFDSGTAEPRWASIPHGIYISIGASGVHRSLGVRVSFVQSTTMDSWKPLHLRMMELGGNQRFQAFLDEHDIPKDMPIREKYQTRAAAWYRENLRAEAEGATPPAPLEPGTGRLLTCEALSQEQLMLDRIFAQAPRQGEMTEGGVPVCSTSVRGVSARARSRRARKCGLVGVMKSGRAQMAIASAAVAELPALLPDQLRALLAGGVAARGSSGPRTPERQDVADLCKTSPRSRSRSRSFSPARTQAAPDEAEALSLKPAARECE